MARRSKKTLSQHVVSAATPALPTPVRNVVTSRVGAPLTIAAAVVLTASGIIKLNWSEGRPHVTVDRARVEEIRQQVPMENLRDKIPVEQIREQIPEEIRQTVDAIRQFEMPLSNGQAGAPASAAAPTAPAAPAGPAASSGPALVTGSPPPTWPTTSFFPVAPAAPAMSAAPAKADTRPADAIRVASFNVQVFGTSKAQKPHVMKILADVVRRFDVVAIQELRTTDATVMERLVELVNSQGDQYQFVAGPRLGRTSSKEQYVFVYNPERVELLPGTALTLEDPQDLLHREPMIGHFRTRVSGMTQPFSFILVNTHTDPDETDLELDVLGEAFEAVQQNPWREDDVVLLGDLNVDYRKLGKLGTLPEIAYTVHAEPTNTRGSETYDNIVFNRVATREFTGKSGVLNLQKEFGLTLDQALEVSDHQPIWAEFTITEAPNSAFLASRPSAAPAAATAPPMATNQAGAASATATAPYGAQAPTATPPAESANNGGAAPQPPGDTSPRTGFRGLLDRMRN